MVSFPLDIFSLTMAISIWRICRIIISEPKDQPFSLNSFFRLRTTPTRTWKSSLPISIDVVRFPFSPCAFNLLNYKYWCYNYRNILFNQRNSQFSLHIYHFSFLASFFYVQIIERTWSFFMVSLQHWLYACMCGLHTLQYASLTWYAAHMKTMKW